MNRISAIASRMVLFIALAIFFNACKKDDKPTNNDRVVKTGIPLEVSQERPTPTVPAGYTGSGSIDIDYTKSSKMLMYTVRWNNLTGNASAMHFHGPASRTETTSPVVPVSGFTPAASGTFSDMKTLTAQQETDFLAGKWYFNIHTQSNGPGEIRGQIEF